MLGNEASIRSTGLGDPAERRETTVSTELVNHQLSASQSSAVCSPQVVPGCQPGENLGTEVKKSQGQGESPVF